MTYWEFTGKLTPEKLEAQRGGLLFTCSEDECGRSVRMEPEVLDGHLVAPPRDCICGNDQWLYCPESCHLLSLNGLLGWKAWGQAHWIEIKDWLLHKRFDIQYWLAKNWIEIKYWFIDKRIVIEFWFIDKWFDIKYWLAIFRRKYIKW